MFRYNWTLLFRPSRKFWIKFRFIAHYFSFCFLSTLLYSISISVSVPWNLKFQLITYYFSHKFSFFSTLLYSISISIKFQHFILLLFLCCFLHYMYFDKCFVSVARVFIETDDCLARKKRMPPSIFRAEETSLTISVRLREYENTKHSHRDASSPPPPPFHRWDKSMLHEFTADELARSYREITRYKPIPVDSPRFVNHRPFRPLPHSHPPLRDETQLLSFRPTK